MVMASPLGAATGGGTSPAARPMVDVSLMFLFRTPRPAFAAIDRGKTFHF
jgi:hypothetical protein